MKQLIASIIALVSLTTSVIAQPLDYVAELSPESLPQNYFYGELSDILPMYDMTIYKTWEVISSRTQRYKNTLGFVPGNCTVYVAHRRSDLFKWKDQNVLKGDAYTWISQAKKLGLSVWKEPKRWAIAVFSPGRWALSLGHVAYVEYVWNDDRIVISDMNYKQKHVVTERVIPSNLAAIYIY